MAESKKEKVTYYCKATKQTIEVVKGSNEEKTLKRHKQWQIKTSV